MKKELLMKGLVKIISAFVLMCLLLFLPAGTWRYPGAWWLIGLLCISMLIMGGFMLVKAPKLLEKRLHSKEQEPQQKLVNLLSSLIFIFGFVLAGLDYRHGWTPLPFTIQLIGAVLFLLSYGMFAEVMRENAYLSRTVEIQDGQRVVDTGLYGIVRHPMYMVVMFLFFIHAFGTWVRPWQFYHSSLFQLCWCYVSKMRKRCWRTG